MSNIDVYLSTLIPHVISCKDAQKDGIKINGDEISVYLTQTGNSVKYIITVPMLKDIDRYVSSIWDKSDNKISWERSILEYKVDYKDVINTDKITETFYYPSINIKYYHPSEMYIPNQYWNGTRVEVKNFNEIKPYDIFICEVRPKEIDDNYNAFNDFNLEEYIEKLEFYNQQIIDLTNRNLSLESEFLILKELLQNVNNTIDELFIDKDTLSEIEIFQKIQNNLTILKEKYIDDKITFTLSAVNKIIDNINQQVQNKKSYWLVAPPSNMQEFIESNPYPRFGEYIQLRWFMRVYERNNNTLNYIDKQEVIEFIKYESPLFTGGIITNKRGEGINTRYDVEIYGLPYYNIMPTDLFDYEVGKWVYLLKSNANLTGEHQKYGSNDIKQESSVSDEKKYLLQITNQYRINNGLEPLVYNKYLDDAIQKHVEDMVNRKFFSHYNPEGLNQHDRITDAGYYKDLSLTTLWADSENLHYHTTIEKIIIERNESGTANNIKIFDVHANADLALKEWRLSTLHNQNLLTPEWTETGLGVYRVPNPDTSKDDFTYYGQVFAYRNDGINVGIESIYRITPFNFGGQLDVSDKMAIHYENELYIDSAIHFEQVFDMIKYNAEIKTVDYSNDKAIVDIPITDTFGNAIIKTVELPIFYHCNGQPVTSGGSQAFKIGDTCIVKRLKEVEQNGIKPDDFSNAYIVAHTDKLQTCATNMYIAQASYSRNINPRYLLIKDGDVLNNTEYKGDMPYETTSSYFPLFYLTYDDLTVKYSLHGVNIYPKYSEWWGYAEHWEHEQSIQCLYKGKVIEFDNTINYRFQPSNDEIELLELINQKRIEYNRTPLIENMCLSLACHLYDQNYYSGIGAWNNHIPIYPVNMTPLKQVELTGYLNTMGSTLAQGDIQLININKNITPQQIIDLWFNDEAYISTKNTLLNATSREIGVGIYINNNIKTFKVFLGFNTSSVLNSTKSILHFGGHIQTSNKYFGIDIKEVTENDNSYIKLVTVGTRYQEYDDITNVYSTSYPDNKAKLIINEYKLNDKVENPYMEQIYYKAIWSDETYNLRKILGVKIVDYDENIIYFNDGYSYNTKYNTYSTITVGNYNIWNFITKQYYFGDTSYSYRRYGIMDINGLTYIKDNNYPIKDEISQKPNTNLQYQADDKSIDMYSSADNEYSFLQAVLMHSKQGNTGILYSKYYLPVNQENLDYGGRNWWEEDENDDGDFETYIIMSDIGKISIPEQWGIGYFVQLDE